MATKLQKAADGTLPHFLTLDELAWHLRVSRTTTLRMLRRGEFPATVRIGEAGHYRIPRAAVEAWEGRQTAAAPLKGEMESPAADQSVRGEDGNRAKGPSACGSIIPQ
jgi:excisionase family DNA binding protein